MDTTSWNVNGARLPQFMKNLEKRTQVIALQEVRTPRESTWVSMHGYMIVFAEKEARESGVTMAIFLKKYTLKVRDARRHYIEIALADDVLECGIGCVYIPPDGEKTRQRRGDRAGAREGEGLRHHCGQPQLASDEAGVADPRAGMRGDPEPASEWRGLEARGYAPRKWMMSVWPLPAKIVPLRTSADFGTRVDWKWGLEYMLDCIMTAPAWSCQGLTAGQVPATIPTDHKPMAARLTCDAVERMPGRKGARAVWASAEDCRSEAKSYKKERSGETDAAKKVDGWANLLSYRFEGRARARARAAWAPDVVQIHEEQVAHFARGILVQAAGALLEGRASAARRARSWGLRARRRKQSAAQPGRPMRSGRVAGLSGREVWEEDELMWCVQLGSSGLVGYA